MRRRTAVAGGAVLSLVAVAASSVVWTRHRSDGGPRPPTPIGRAQEPAPGEPLATLDRIVADLPPRGIGIVDGDLLVLVDENGLEVARGSAGSPRLVSPEDV